jgi:putative ABC transport system permease protein
MTGRVREGWRRLRSLGRSELDSGLDQEIRFHIDSQTEKNLRAGMAPDEARRQALIKFGGVEGARESTRDQFRWAFVEAFLRDLRYGGRALRRAPGFTIVATLTLALGIGATTAMFSLVNGILLRPLPYPEQDRLIELVHEAPGLGIVRIHASPAVYFGYRDHSQTFEAVGLWDWDSSPVTVTGSGEPEAVRSLEVTHEVLTILGAAPIVGRGFRAADDLPGSVPTAIVSYGYGQRHFGGAGPLGQTLVVDGIPRQVIGVLPQWFRFFDYPAEIFYPRQPVRSGAVFPSGDGRGIARLKEGVTLGEANADVARMIPILSEEFPGGNVKEWRFGPKLRWLKDTVVGDLRDTLWLLMGTIGLLLLIACANVANLVLVRTETRRPELAIRAALGAGWGGIARVVFAESAILGLAGGVAGLSVAYVALPLLLSLGAADLPDIMTVTIDPTVLLVTVGISVLATLMFALIPVLHIALPKLQLAGVLRGASRSITEGRETNRARHLLVVAQVALALVLLIGSGLMMRTFQTLRQVDPGFRDPGNVQTFQLTIPTADVAPAEPAGAPAPTPARTIRIQHEILDRLAVVAGVESAGFSSSNDGLPLDGDGKSRSIFVEGRTTPIDGAATLKEVQFVSPHFFETLRTPLMAGRSFDWNDVDQARPVVLVSENLARGEWGSASAALGKRIGPREAGPWSEVVGVVKDVHHDGLSQPAPETVIFPPRADDTASFVVRSERVGTISFLEDLRRAVWSVNPNLSLASVQTLDDMYQRSMARTSMTLQLFAITGAMALLLGLIGIYGVVSYAVSQRRREIGIRLALGAAHSEVRRMFVRHALVLVGIGVAIGLAAAVGLTRLMESQLFGVSRLDPLTHLAVALTLLAAAGLASYLSARRASALDPVEVLKGA